MKKIAKYFTGILGGLIFSIPWLLVYVFLNLSVGYLDCLIVFGIVLGYKLVNKDIYNDTKTRIYLIISSCLIALLNVLVLMPIIVMIKEGTGVTLESFKVLYTNKEFLCAVVLDVILALLMVLAPSIFFQVDFKNIKTDKPDIQTFIDELEKIFNNHGATTKETAVSKKIIKDDISNLEISKFKKLFYMDAIKSRYIKTTKGKWYFEPKKNTKKNQKYGLAFAIYTLVAITVVWNAVIMSNSDNIDKSDNSKSKIIEYKIENDAVLMLPDCMKLDEKNKKTENNIDVYYYSYLSEDISKSNIQVVEIFYYPSFDYQNDYDGFKTSIKNSLSESEISLEKDKIFNGNNTLYLKLNKYDKQRIVNSYFVMLPNNKLIEAYVYVTKDGYSNKDENASDDIVKSIRFNF